MTAVTPEAFASAHASYRRAWHAADAEGVGSRSAIALRVALAELGVTVGRPAPPAERVVHPVLPATVVYDGSAVCGWRVLDHRARQVSVAAFRLRVDAERLAVLVDRDGHLVDPHPYSATLYERLSRS